MAVNPSLPVSVIIPVYNGERFVAEALASIINQSTPPQEILVIDDGSTDQTAAIVRHFGASVHYSYRPNGGPAAARNTGIRLAQGELIAFLDVDDLWTPTSLAQQQACLAANPAAGISLGCLQLLVETSSADERTAFVPWSIPRRIFVLQCAVVRRTVFTQIGLLDEGYGSAEDIDWFMRAREAGITIVTHDRTTVLARRHGQNLTNQQTRAHHDLARALKNSLARRNADTGEASLPALVHWSAPVNPATAVGAPDVNFPPVQP